MKQEPSKRIVSQGKHVQLLIERALGNVSGFGLWLIACLFLVAFIYGTCSLIYDIIHHRPPTLLQVQSFWTLVCVSPFVLYLFVKAGQHNIRYASTLDVGVPLTRANTGLLPTPESLVRASQKPLHEQQAVLLRATIQGMETLPEELVRAAEGEEW